LKTKCSKDWNTVCSGCCWNRLRITFMENMYVTGLWKSSGVKKLK